MDIDGWAYDPFQFHCHVETLSNCQPAWTKKKMSTFCTRFFIIWQLAEMMPMHAPWIYLVNRKHSQWYGTLRHLHVFSMSWTVVHFRWENRRDSSVCQFRHFCHRLNRCRWHPICLPIRPPMPTNRHRRSTVPMLHNWLLYCRRVRMVRHWNHRIPIVVVHLRLVEWISRDPVIWERRKNRRFHVIDSERSGKQLMGDYKKHSPFPAHCAIWPRVHRGVPSNAWWQHKSLCPFQWCANWPQ